MAAIVAIVGRPNVGKSTLFNRLIGERKAIVDDISGVTRDRLYGTANWNGKNFTVIDTGGFVENSDDIFEAAIREQVHIAIQEAQLIVFVVDVATGITDLDGQMAEILRKGDKPVVVVVNKVDNNARMLEANEFWSLGFEHTYFLAAISGSGSGEMLDALTDLIPKEVDEMPDLPKFAIVGRPNVGKSSFTNALVGAERNIVTDIAGTTRDSIHTRYSKFDMEFMLIDTAGIRKKSSVHENLEFYSVLRAIRAIEESDVCFLLIDAQEGIEKQDLSIFQLALKRNKGVVVLVNKWDLIEKQTATAEEFSTKIYEKLAPMNDVPVLFISALEKQRIHKALQVGLEVHENRQRKISTSKLNEFVKNITEKHPPPSHRGKFISIKYATQLPTYYPAFAFFCNHPKHVKESYRNYMENQLREVYNFTGCPIGIYFRQK